MHADNLFFLIFVIFTGAAVLATVALYARQSLIVAYILLGALLGPHALGLVEHVALIERIADFGILFLLFLLGLDLDPQRLLPRLGQALHVTLLSGLAFAGVGFAVAAGFGLGWTDALLVGVAMSFSSTILGLKLLPTTVLHHKHMGEVIISILLLQDILAIVVLIVLQAAGGAGNVGSGLLRAAVALPAVVLLAVLAERYLLYRLLVRFDTIREYIFLVAIGWCLGLAQLAAAAGLSHEVGAFIAGVALARRPIALYITDSLKPLRDFFLILFFFALGAAFDPAALDRALWPALAAGGILLVVKPWLFSHLLRRVHEEAALARETGVRLGQVSEFSLLVALVGVQSGVLGGTAAEIIQLTVLATFVVSSYYIVMRYPTPIAVSDRLRRD